MTPNNYLKLVVGGRVQELFFFCDEDHESAALAHLRARDASKEAMRHASYLATRPRVAIVPYRQTRDTLPPTALSAMN